MHSEASTTASAIQFPFSELAIEIREIIFQYAAKSDKPSRWALSLVSLGVQKLTDPILFRHVTFTEKDPDDPMEDMDRFEGFLASLFSEDATPRFNRALSYVRTFHLAYSMGHTEVGWHAILKAFPKLVAVAVAETWDYIDLDSCEDGEEHPTLRHVYGSIGGRFSLEDDCKMFSNITHMEFGRWDISYGPSSFNHWSMFKNLLYVSVDGELWEDIGEMMSCLPSTILLVLFVLKSEEDDEVPLDRDVLENYNNMKYDPRFLLFWCSSQALPPEAGTWILRGNKDISAMDELRAMWGSKEATFWERGLNMVEDRRRSTGVK